MIRLRRARGLMGREEGKRETSEFFCFVLFSFNFVFCVLSLTILIFLWPFVISLVNLFGVFYFTLFTVVVVFLFF